MSGRRKKLQRATGNFGVINVFTLLMLVVFHGYRYMAKGIKLYTLDMCSL